MNRSRRWRRNLFVYLPMGFAAAALLLFALLAWLGWDANIDPSPRLELYKISLQFLLVTALGAVLVWSLNFARDLHSREEQSRDEVRSLHARASELYRLSKKLKRKLRSYSSWRGHDNSGAIIIKEEKFLEIMDEFLQTQIGYEMLREEVTMRDDLFSLQKKNRIVEELHFVARYAHDVYEELERKKISKNDGEVEITEDCKMLRDFVSQSDVPDLVRSAWGELIRVERESATDLTKRHQLLMDVAEQLRKAKRDRFGSAASAFAHLAMDQIRDGVEEKRRWPRATAVPTASRTRTS